MKIRNIFPAICLLALTSCNNSSDNKKGGTDSSNNMMNDTSHHMTTGVNVPDLPAIPDGAKVMFKNLKDGQEVSSPFKVEMGTENIKVDTAGPVVPGSGHHHLMIDGPDSLAAGTMVPKDSTHLHFGKGQTETELKLAPGKHKLTLQFADGLHRSYGGKLTATVTVDVKK
jgi:hypothetical protein